MIVERERNKIIIPVDISMIQCWFSKVVIAVSDDESVEDKSVVMLLWGIVSFMVVVGVGGKSVDKRNEMMGKQNSCASSKYKSWFIFVALFGMRVCGFVLVCRDN